MSAPLMDPKDPQETKDYYVDWANVLATGETIASDTWTIPTGISEAAALTATVGAISYVGLTGGTAGQSYTLVCTMTTSAGRIFERSIRVPVVQL
jgi:hypothetical protein